MRVAIDTNRLTDLFKGDADLASYLGTCDEVWLPFVVPGEIKAGFYGGTRQAQNELLALENDLALITRDGHFNQIPQLRRI